MPGDVQYRMPGVLSLPTQWFGLLTTRELLRIATPVLLATMFVFLPTTWTELGLIGLSIGLGLYLSQARIAGYPVETAAFNLGVWLVDQQDVWTGPVRTRQYRTVETRDGAVIAVLQVTPVNMGLQTQSEQRAIHAIWQTMIDAVGYPVGIQSRQRYVDLDDYVDRIQTTSASEETEVARQIREAYTAYADGLNHDDLTVTEHYVVVRVQPGTCDRVDTDTQIWTRLTHIVDTFRARITDSERSDPGDSESADPAAQQLLSTLDHRCAELTQLLNRGGLTASRLTGQDLQEFVTRTYTGTADCTPATATVSQATDAAETDEHTHHHHLVDGFPAQLPVAWPDALFDCDALVDITQIIQPRPTTEVITDLRHRLNRLEAEIDAQTAAGYSGTNQYEARATDANWLLDLLADREATACQYGCLITVHHPDPAVAQDAVDQVQTRLAGLQVETWQPRFQTPRWVRAWSLFHQTDLPTRLVPSPSAATGFPATTITALNTDGVIYGEHRGSRTPLILDRFQWSSHAVARMGMVGSGKSYATKLELVRAWCAYDDVQIYVVDPKQEYSHLIRQLGGTVYTVDPASSASIPTAFNDDLVAIQVADRGDTENTAVLRDVVQRLYAATSQDRRKTLVVIDEARILLNDPAGRDTVNQFVLEARDTNTAITMVTQNASHFTHHRQGREILDNVPAKVFMRHDRVPQSVVDYFQLSERERQTLYTLQTGTDSVCSEAVLQVADHGIDTTLTIRATAPEHRVITAAENASPAHEDDQVEAADS